MKKWIAGLIVVVAILVFGFLGFNGYIYNEKQGGVADYREVEFLISGELVRMVDGEVRTQTVTGSTSSPQSVGASANIVRYFGNDAKGDLNGDGVPDVAFLITQDTGGSGTFFYVVGAIQNTVGRYHGTEAAYIGDRIAPQSTEIRDGLLIVNYADRAPTAPMAAPPTVGKSLYLKLDPHTLQFGEVVQNLEGESAR